MLTVKRIFSDGMIIQRDTENTVSGRADAGCTVTVRLLKDGLTVFSGETQCGEDCRWSVVLPPVKGSTEPYELIISAGKEKITVRDVCFGELFHISGQSNMELPMSRTRDPFGEEHIWADNPFIREFRVPVSCRFSKDATSEDFKAWEWKKAAGADTADISAAGCYFAADIFERLKVPVGLLNTSAGGAAIESFMPYEMIRKYKIHDEFLETATRENYMENTAAADMQREARWNEALGTEDFGLATSEDMKCCTVPCQVKELDGLENFSGRLFFFKETNVPDDFDTENAELILGTITDSDTAYINGVKVGETGYMYPPRYYKIPSGVLKKGKNIIAVRVEMKGGCGGFTKGKRYCIKSGSRIIHLSGEWKYAVAAKAEPLVPSTFFQGLPLALYSDMMAPAFNVKCRALVWYQGETNCGRAYLYKQMFADFIKLYRSSCGYDIPVIFTQLCGFEGMCGKDESQSWAGFRQAQLECLETEGTAMAVTVDIGEYNDLHPKNKRDVGKRLAARAGELIYGDRPTFARCTDIWAREAENGTEITLKFDNDVYLRNDRTGAFDIVFEDGIFGCTADGEQKCGRTLRLVCPHKGKLLSVRYAFQNDPREIDLYELTMLPASPFEAVL